VRIVAFILRVLLALPGIVIRLIVGGNEQLSRIG